MGLEPTKAIERSVDSVAKIYAIIIGLALTESVKTLIVKDTHGNISLDLPTLWAGSPAFLAFVFTLVPFWHGMNRHLDRCYLEKAHAVVHGALLLDLSVFFIEASIFLIGGWSLRSGLSTFYCLGVVLLIDVVWAAISHQIHFPGERSHSLSWSTINIGAILAMLGVLTFSFDPKPPLLMAIAMVRTIVDYRNGRAFYFPDSVRKITKAEAGLQPRSIPRR
ncbi:MAG: hypothetical protein JWN34_5310 [Bryobacterales bacterium]|nr:hypothetical protein [Bryobacterales bacterium]